MNKKVLALSATLFAVVSLTPNLVSALPQCEEWKPSSDYLQAHENHHRDYYTATGNAPYMSDLDNLYGNPNTDAIIFQKAGNPNYFLTISGQKTSSGNQKANVYGGPPSTTNYYLNTNPNGNSQHLAYTLEYNSSGDVITPSGTAVASTTYPDQVSCVQAVSGYTDDTPNQSLEASNEFPHAETGYSWAKFRGLFTMSNFRTITDSILNFITSNMMLLGVVATVLGFRFLLNRFSSTSKARL